MLTAFDHTLEGVTLGPAIADESTPLIDLAKVARLSAGREGGAEHRASPQARREPREETLSVDDEAEGARTSSPISIATMPVMRALAMHGDPTGGVDEETTAPGEARRIANNATVPMTHLPRRSDSGRPAPAGRVTPSRIDGPRIDGPRIDGPRIDGP
ncbi:MAG: hypothetical protein R3B72_32905 [Polyangiaceae bacterium]